MANEIVGLWDIIVDGVECLLDRDKCKEEAEAKAIRAANRGCIVHLGLPGHVSLGSLVLAKSAGVSASADVSYKLASALMSGPILCTVAQFVVAASAHLGIQRTLATTTKQEVLRSHIELFGAHLIRVERAIAEYTPSRFGEVEDSYPVHHYYVGGGPTGNPLVEKVPSVYEWSYPVDGTYVIRALERPSTEAPIPDGKFPLGWSTKALAQEARRAQIKSMIRFNTDPLRQVREKWGELLTGGE